LIELWNEALLEPILNGLVWLSNIFGGNFGLAIIIITLLINLILLPLTWKTTRSMKNMQVKMQVVQPKMQEIQKKYAKDKQRQQQEIFKLYKEQGISPMGCVTPMLLLFIQMPFWIAIYQSIINALPTTPEHLFGLSLHLYSTPSIQEGIPPNSHFMGMDLSQPNFLFVMLVMLTMWLSQRMSSVPSADPKQRQQQQMMEIMFPLVFGFIFIGFPSGLPLYIVVSNVFRMVVQRLVMGNWGNLPSLMFWQKKPAAAAAQATAAGTTPSMESPKPSKNVASDTTKKGAKEGKSLHAKKPEKKRSPRWKLWK